MISKSQRNTFLIVPLIVLGLSQSCAGIAPATSSPVAPTATVTLTTTSTPVLTKTAIPSFTPTITLTPVPRGVLVLFFYPPLGITYDPSIWVDKSNYAEWGENLNPPVGVIIDNYLQALSLETCLIGVIGPSGNFPSPDRVIQLGNVRYQVTTSEDKSRGLITALYIEDQSITGYDYDQHGLPVLEIVANPSQWDECKTLGEKVLSTLRVP